MSELFPIGAVLLAAGASSRMGHPKALIVRRDGRTLLRAACDSLAAASLEPLVVVLGHHHELLEQELRAHSPAVRVVLNPVPERGQVSSFALGLAAAAPGRAAIVALVDHPALSLELLARLAEAARQEPDAIHIPVHRGARGHPVAFPTSLAEQLSCARPGEGARDVVARLGLEVREHEVESPDALLDLDTPAQLAAWRLAEEVR